MLVMLGLCCWRSLLELPQWRKSMSQDETRCYLRQIVRESEVAQLCPTLCDPIDCKAYNTPLSMGFSRQEYWSGLPFSSPEDLPNPGIEPGSPTL